jgi:hypothetical protein
MKSLARFEDVELGQVFYMAGGVARSFIKLSETQASPASPVQSVPETEALTFNGQEYVFVDTDYNVCDDAFLESAIRDSTLRFDFSRALYLLKSRDCVVTRQAWELLGQPVVFLSPGVAQFNPDQPPPPVLTSIPSYLYRNQQNSSDTVVPVLNFKFRNGQIDTGWTPTTLDIMAEDWYVPHLPKKGYAIHPDPILPL